MYIVGFSLSAIESSPSKLEFLSGLGYAIYVAAFDLDEKEAPSEDRTELDNKEPALRDPARTVFSSLNLEGMARNESELSLPRSVDSVGDGIVGLSMEPQPDSPLRLSDAPLQANASVESLAKVGTISLGGMRPSTSAASASAWDAGEHFSFPVAAIPVKLQVPDDLTLEDFKDVYDFKDVFQRPYEPKAN